MSPDYFVTDVTDRSHLIRQISRSSIDHQLMLF